MKTKKLTEEQLESIKDFEGKISQLTQELGIAFYEEGLAKRRVESITKAVENTLEEKSKYYEELRKEYGDGTVDLDKGTFTATEQN